MMNNQIVNFAAKKVMGHDARSILRTLWVVNLFVVLHAAKPLNKDYPPPFRKK